MFVCEPGFFDGWGCIRRWVKMWPRFVWFQMAVSATLPGRFGARFEIVERVVAALEPADIDSGVVHCGGILLAIELEFEVAWRERVGLVLPAVDERVCASTSSNRFECRRIERSTGTSPSLTPGPRLRDVSPRAGPLVGVRGYLDVLSATH